MKIKKTFFAAVSVMALAGYASVPEITAAQMAQATDSRKVTITYTLKNTSAVVTLDVETNTTDGAWVSIGGKAVCNAQGDVWKKIVSSSEDGTYQGTITWRPDLSWPDHKIPAGGARAVVTAWSLNNTPDYMVVDISASATPNSQRYYPEADYLPGGLLSNHDYRTTSIVMRKIMAKDVVCRTTGDCMICMVMYGSGVLTGLRTTLRKTMGRRTSIIRLQRRLCQVRQV